MSIPTYNKIHIYIYIGYFIDSLKFLKYWYRYWYWYRYYYHCNFGYYNFHRQILFYILFSRIWKNYYFFYKYLENCKTLFKLIKKITQNNALYFETYIIDLDLDISSRIYRKWKKFFLKPMWSKLFLLIISKNQLKNYIYTDLEKEQFIDYII